MQTTAAASVASACCTAQPSARILHLVESLQRRPAGVGWPSMRGGPPWPTSARRWGPWWFGAGSADDIAVLFFKSASKGMVIYSPAPTNLFFGQVKG